MISRSFDAPRDLAFRAMDEARPPAEAVGPKDFTVFHCASGLRAGGLMHYGLRTAQGQEMWGNRVYRGIKPTTHVPRWAYFHAGRLGW